MDIKKWRSFDIMTSKLAKMNLIKSDWIQQLHNTDILVLQLTQHNEVLQDAKNVI